MYVSRSLVGVTILAAALFLPRPFTDDVSARLVSVEEFPTGAMCEWIQNPAGVTPDLVASAHRQQSQQPFLLAQVQQGLEQRNLFAALQRGGARSIPAQVELTRSPIRTLRDTYPTYTAVAVNLQTNEVYLQDNNLWSTRIFDRLANTPDHVDVQEPKRILQGSNTHIQFNNGLYIDPKNGDVYAVESDVGDRMIVFSQDAQGNVKPQRELHTPHRAYNIAMDEERQEMFISREYPSEIVVYRKSASGEDHPIRILQGDRTGLEAPHGLVVDVKNQLLYVNNWGLADQLTLGGSGRFNPPSIKVYALNASGDTPPLRVIQGNRTQLNWPGAMSLDPNTGDLYVANDVNHSVLVFAGANSLNGNVAPARVIKGTRTGLRNPTGIFVDAVHQELWVSNLGNSSAVAFPLKANGDVAPLRTIRSSPKSHLSLTFGRSTAVTFDGKRSELLVPNCVNHPQIAAFARLAVEDTPPLRKLEGQGTLLGRTMHDLAFDAIHDEIVVTNPFAQAILTFRGGAEGEEAPIRVIQGVRTRLNEARAMDKVAIDPVHNEIFITTGADNVLVFAREANGDVPPIRVLGGPDTLIGERPTVRVDPVRNLLFVAGQGGLLVFDRMASGNARPRVIEGPRSGHQFELYSPSGLIITHRSGALEGWSIEEGLQAAAANGNGRGALRPLWAIATPRFAPERMAGTGIALDPAHKEVIASTGAGNTIFTFSIPEAFEQPARQTAQAR
jgi:DNA-binding beta-propeller fold protein YncE